MSTNVVTLTFAGDPSALTKSVKTVNTDLDSVGSASQRNSRSFEEGAGKISKTAKGVKDSMEGTIAAATAMGYSFPGEQAIAFATIAFDMSKGVKDLSEGLGGALSAGLTKVKGLMGIGAAETEVQTTATEEATVANDGLNESLLANPIGLVIALAAGLVLGFYELYEHCTAFRDIVKSAFKVVLDTFTSVWGWVKSNWPLLLAILTGPIGLAVLAIDKYWDKIKSGIGDLISGIKKVIGAVTNIIEAPFTAAFDGIRAAWNDTVGRVSFHIPGWVPGIGGDGFSFPQMANGGRTNGGWTVVGERGPELVNLPAGSGVIANGRAPGGGGGPTNVTIDFSGVSTDNLIDALRRGVKARGGNVQTVLGVAR